MGDNASDSNCYWDPGPHSIGTEDSLDDEYSGDIDAVKTHEYARQAFFFYHDRFGLETDNFGGQIEVGIHAYVPNARWHMGCDIAEFSTGWVSYDIIVHEFAHGVDPIGLDKMAGLFFYTFTTSLPSNSTMKVAAALTTKIAEVWGNDGTNGFTKNDACQVRNAFAAVELVSGDSGCDGTLDDAKDTDGDYIPDSIDNCVNVKNPIQFDFDKDGVGNACDSDADNDAVENSKDNCSLVYNPTQTDVDHDGIGDACDDSDGDGVRDDKDNCVNEKNPSQVDTDFDDIGDTCDDDIDGDAVKNEADNCTYDMNPDQKDTDNDGEGDVCDVDSDADGLSNDHDNCPFTPNPKQENSDGDGAGDACDPTPICNDVEAWSKGLQIGDDFIPPQPLANPQACTPDAMTPSIEIKPGIDIVSASQQVDIAGKPGGHVILPLPDCEPDQNGWYSQDRRALLTLDGLGQGVRFKVVDSDRMLLPAASVVMTTSEPVLSPVTETPTPTFTPVPAQSCTWTAAINIFVRQGPGSSQYKDIWSYSPSQSAPVIGQSPDGSWWVLETPGGTGFVPKAPRFGSASGMCEGLQTFDPPPTITPTFDPGSSETTPEIPLVPDLLIPSPSALPQCSDRIDNDADGRIDLDDSQCRNNNDNDEAVP